MCGLSFRLFCNPLPVILFGDPAADGLIGNVDTTLKQHFHDFTQAQIEPQIKPNGVSNDLWRKR